MSDPALQACDDHIASCGIDTNASGWRTNLTQPPTFPFEDSKTYYWNIETNVGDIKVKLRPDIAPNHRTTSNPNQR